jgi:beta-fructofuranosidase
VTAEAARPQTATSARPRPRVHFTADDGWINDPYGVAWIDGRYHLYYQAIPGRVSWAPTCHWGHARSDDLVHWVEQPLALVPRDFETGCWSGSVVDDTEPPVIFYTRVTGTRPQEWEIGQVAIATLDRATGTWRTSASDVLIEAPPAELNLRSFRDPNVFRREDDWALLMAAALPDGSGAVLQYSSPDLQRWTYDGVLCSRPNDPNDAVPTGALWECPQLFAMGDRWVLVISAWDNATLLHVAAAIGSYDGLRFHPTSWQRLTYGQSAYATTAFVDRDGRRCLMSWLREEPQNNDALTERAGAHSVVSTLSLGPDGILSLTPHPDVDALRGPALTGRPTALGLEYDVADAPVDMSVAVSPGLLVEIIVDGRSRARLSYDADRRLLLIDRAGLPAGELPLVDRGGRIRLLLDADILEIFAGRTYGAYRTAVSADPATTTIVLAAPGTTEAVVRPLVVA